MQKCLKSVCGVCIGLCLCVAVHAAVRMQTKQRLYINPQHKTATLVLNSNPTTGFRWFVLSYDRHLVTLQSHRYQASMQKKGLVGAGGKEYWTFEATKEALKAPCIADVHLIYARSWEMANQTTEQLYKLQKVFYVVIG